jgi:hypothetical protein
MALERVFMAYEISRKEVLDNLVRFKNSLAEIHDGHNERAPKRVYKLLLNRKTGDMRFAKSINALETHISKRASQQDSVADWKEVKIIVFEKGKKDAAHFEIGDSLEHPLESSDIDPLAWKIAGETLAILNQKAKHCHSDSKLPEEELLSDLSDVRLFSTKDEISDLPGWVGTLERKEAEKRLLQKSVGTYLLRAGDEATFKAAFHLEEANSISVYPYLITMVDEDEKISEILILKTSLGWTIYSDNPDLKDRTVYSYYPSIKELLQSMGNLAKNPLF